MTQPEFSDSKTQSPSPKTQARQHLIVARGKTAHRIVKYVKYLSPKYKNKIARFQWKTQPIHSDYYLVMVREVNFSSSLFFSYFLIFYNEYFFFSPKAAEVHKVWIAWNIITVLEWKKKKITHSITTLNKPTVFNFVFASQDRSLKLFHFLIVVGIMYILRRHYVLFT